jgi:hypothetical protein
MVRARKIAAKKPKVCMSSNDYFSTPSLPAKPGGWRKWAAVLKYASLRIAGFSLILAGTSYRLEKQLRDGPDRR